MAVEIAAGLLGLTAPVRPGPDAAEMPALPAQESVRYRLACAAMSAAPDGDSVARAPLRESPASAASRRGTADPARARRHGSAGRFS